MAKYLLPGETLPEPPAKNPVISLSPVTAAEFAPIFANLPAPAADAQPRNFEVYDQNYGCIDYRTKIPAGPAALVEAPAINDIGQVFVDGVRIGFTDRRSRNFKVRLPARAQEATLDIFVEAMGRVNFGAEVLDRKGIHGPVTLGGQVLTGWQIYNLPLDDRMLAGLKYTPDTGTRPAGPAFYRAVVKVGQPGDCFLDMRPWGKGFAWVNGHNLGRYWDIGPQQTMYVPGPWLKPGDNEVVILDLLGPQQPVVAALDQPILDQLRPQLDFVRNLRPAAKVKLTALPAVFTGSFAPGADLQEVKFPQPATGRYFAIESLDAFDGGPFAAIAEIALLDESGKPLAPKAGPSPTWTARNARRRTARRKTPLTARPPTTGSRSGARTSPRNRITSRWTWAKASPWAVSATPRARARTPSPAASKTIASTSATPPNPDAPQTRDPRP